MKTKNHIERKISLAGGTLVLGTLLLTAGCSSMGPDTKVGAVTGGAIGAALGGIIGHQSGRALEGAAIGAGVGAVGGGVVGSAQDQRKSAPRR